MKCFIRKAICFTPTLTSGTKPTITARSSAQSAYTLSVVALKELREVKTMKFDYCIGNPAYNLMSENTSDKPIYNDFMDESYKIAKKVELKVAE